MRIRNNQNESRETKSPYDLYYITGNLTLLSSSPSSSLSYVLWIIQLFLFGKHHIITLVFVSSPTFLLLLSDNFINNHHLTWWCTYREPNKTCICVSTCELLLFRCYIHHHCHHQLHSLFNHHHYHYRIVEVIRKFLTFCVCALISHD